MQAAQPFCTAPNHLCVVLLVETPMILRLHFAFDLEFSLHGSMGFKRLSWHAILTCPITMIGAQHDHKQLCKIMCRLPAVTSSSSVNHASPAGCNLNKPLCLASAKGKRAATRVRVESSQ
jgi:hypothetical protein